MSDEGALYFDAFPPVYRQGEYFCDNWGCLWYNEHAGLEGQAATGSRTSTERRKPNWCRTAVKLES